MVALAQVTERTLRVETGAVDTPISGVVIYARSATGENDHIAEQIDQCLSVADEHDWNVVGIYRDIGAGDTIDHPEMQQMREYLHSRPLGVDAVLAVNIDRLTRDFLNWKTLHREFSALGLYIVQADGEILPVYDATDGVS